MFVGMTIVVVVFFYVIIANGTPKHHEPIEKETPTEYEYSETWYRYSCCWEDGTLRHCPKHKVKGTEIKYPR